MTAAVTARSTRWQGMRPGRPSYDETMDGRLDLSLLQSLVSVDWSAIAAAVDLGCGTGRIGAWVKANGVARVDGVDQCSAMLDRAAAKKLYDTLVCADAATTGLVDYHPFMLL